MFIFKNVQMTHFALRYNPDGELEEEYVAAKRTRMVFPASVIPSDTKPHQSIPSFVISEAFWSQEC